MPHKDPDVRGARDRERFARRTAERRAAGLCPKCGRRPPAEGGATGEPANGSAMPADGARAQTGNAGGEEIPF